LAAIPSRRRIARRRKVAAPGFREDRKLMVTVLLSGKDVAEPAGQRDLKIPVLIAERGA